MDPADTFSSYFLEEPSCCFYFISNHLYDVDVRQPGP